MSHILALVVALGSFGLYMSAFFLPEVYRKNDFIWSGVGMFYALVLWVCAGRITGGVLLGQLASVALLGWLGWQLLESRRLLTPYDQQTRLPGSSRNLGDLLKLASEELPGRLQTQFKALPQQATSLANQVKQRVGKSPKLTGKTVRSLPKATSKPPVSQPAATPAAGSAAPVAAPSRKTRARSPQAVIPTPDGSTEPAPSPPGMPPVADEPIVPSPQSDPVPTQERVDKNGDLAERSPAVSTDEPLSSPPVSESPTVSAAEIADPIADPVAEQAATVAEHAETWVDLATQIPDAEAATRDEAIIELASSAAPGPSGNQPTAPEPTIQEPPEAPAAWFDLATEAAPASPVSEEPPDVGLAAPARSLDVQPLPAEPESDWEFDWEPPISEYVSPDSTSNSFSAIEEEAIAPDDWQDDFDAEAFADQPPDASEDALENAVIVSIERLDPSPITLPLIPEAAPPLHEPVASTIDPEPPKTEPFFVDEEFEYEDWESEPPLAD